MQNRTRIVRIDTGGKEIRNLIVEEFGTQPDSDGGEYGLVSRIQTPFTVRQNMPDEVRELENLVDLTQKSNISATVTGDELPGVVDSVIKFANDRRTPKKYRAEVEPW